MASSWNGLSTTARAPSARAWSMTARVPWSWRTFRRWRVEEQDVCACVRRGGALARLRRATSSAPPSIGALSRSTSVAARVASHDLDA
jgi:hypothetical protein